MNTPQLFLPGKLALTKLTPLSPTPRVPRAVEHIAKRLDRARGILLLLDEGEDRRKMLSGVKNDKSGNKLAQTKLPSPPTTHTPEQPNPPPGVLSMFGGEEEKNETCC